ncbi:phage holin family protein [Deinococcus arenicola]|uniref:Phage holin family protein n=1 Tax=Deinococcus arenicola TaxID=2994950 RepID=A0ABU4DS47_9DEIO|nr:phage holin family protein [Deinococcus sp. ZS9-10]MDV6374509.1 phage holin family protein [Deinococcus sp. ZS9-10]
MEERKSMGGAIVDVFDAGVTLVKSEINALVKKVSDIAKAKGIGVVLLLAATGPLILALIFLILAVFYGLMRLGLGAWAAALLIAVLSFVITGAMILMGIRKLGAEVETDEPIAKSYASMTEDERLEAQYQAEQAEKAAKERRAAQASQVQAPSTKTTVVSPTATSRDAVRVGAGASTGVGMGASVQRSAGNTQAKVGAPDFAKDQDSRQPASRTSVEVPRDPQQYAAGENRFVASDGNTAQVRVEGGTSTVPIYESEPDGSAKMYGGSLNEKLDKGEVASANHAEAGHGHGKPDPRLQNPVVLNNAPGIAVSTEPTYRDDIKKGGGEV